MNEFAKRMKSYMEEFGMSQTDIIEACQPYCKKLGIKLTKSALSQYLAGTKVPKFDKLKVMEYALNVSADWLAGYSDNKEVGTSGSGITELYELLNEDGKNKAIDYISDLIENPRYRK